MRKEEVVFTVAVLVILGVILVQDVYNLVVNSFRSMKEGQRVRVS